MGRGPSPANDPPMRKPRDLLAVIDPDGSQGDGGGEGPPGSRPADACELEQELAFDLLVGVGIDVGDEVVLRLGEPVAVLSGGEQIGVLAGSASRAMRSCVDFGYRMSGAVTALDPSKGSGMIVISGERR